MKRSRKIAAFAAGACAAFALAAYFHFRDDAPPDLSRFPKPAYDVDVFNKFSAVIKRFESEFVAYRPQYPGDIDEDEAEDYDHTVVGAALRGDASGVKCLRRHIEENKACIPLAEQVASWPRLSSPPPNPARPTFIDSEPGTATKKPFAYYTTRHCWKASTVA